jgi:hypothetical protein
VAGATALGSPFIRWQALAALGEAVSVSGEDPSAPLNEAVGIIRSIADNLLPQREATFLADPRVAEVLEAAR